MATSTGKAARKQFGTKVAAKRSKARKRTEKQFGQLPVSQSRGNAAAFVAEHAGEWTGEEVEA